MDSDNFKNTLIIDSNKSMDSVKNTIDSNKSMESNNFENTSIRQHTEFLLLFLCNFDVMFFFESYENLLKCILKSGIPTDLLVTKFYEYMFSCGKCVDDIYLMMHGSSNNFEEIEDDIMTIKNILKITENNQTKFQTYSEKQCTQILKSFEIDKISYMHPYNYMDAESSLPLPDKDLGRPQLEWKICKHLGCSQKFSTKLELINHLSLNHYFKQGFHLLHENCVLSLNLTPEEILSKNLTKCPSYGCHRKKYDSPQKLIKHFKFMGIPPFWQKGMDLSKEFQKESDTLHPSKLFSYSPKLFLEMICIYCLENIPCVISNTCRHHIFCINCYQTQHLNKILPKLCPICRDQIDIFYPYFLST